MPSSPTQPSSLLEARVGSSSIEGGRGAKAAVECVEFSEGRGGLEHEGVHGRKAA